jgi:calcineurin-like phosphoesterase family protein
MIWFSADAHHNHARVLQYCNRPFTSVEDMDETIINNWNERVGHWDWIYYLGDFCFGDSAKAQEYFGRLNGRIKFILTPFHHDRFWYDPNVTYRTLNANVEFLPMIHLLRLSRREVIVLCHYPFASWERQIHGAIHLHGHSHGRYQGKGKIMDVGVDANQFYPVSLEQVRKFMAGKESLNEIS